MGLKTNPLQGRTSSTLATQLPEGWQPLYEGENVAKYIRKIGDTGNIQELSPNDFQLNRWIEGPLTKYVKTRMASPDDEE